MLKRVFPLWIVIAAFALKPAPGAAQTGPDWPRTRADALELARWERESPAQLRPEALRGMDLDNGETAIASMALDDLAAPDSQAAMGDSVEGSD